MAKSCKQIHFKSILSFLRTFKLKQEIDMGIFKSYFISRLQNKADLVKIKLL